MTGIIFSHYYEVHNSWTQCQGWVFKYSRANTSAGIILTAICNLWIEKCLSLVLGRAIHSLAKLGDDLYIESIENELFFRTVNLSKTAYASFSFSSNFFLYFSSEKSGRCGNYGPMQRQKFLFSFKNDLIEFVLKDLDYIFIKNYITKYANIEVIKSTKQEMFCQCLLLLQLIYDILYL